MYYNILNGNHKRVRKLNKKGLLFELNFAIEQK